MHALPYPPAAPIRIRPATEQDRMACAWIFREARLPVFSWLPPEAFRLEEFDRSVEGERVWVAEIEGRVVGFASVWEPSDFVHNLFVDPAMQGRGVGSRLLDHVLAHARGPVRLKCDVDNRRAEAFYRRRGWLEEERGITEGRPHILFRKGG